MTTSKELPMIRLVATALVTLTLALPARAALDIGERAPDFTTDAARDGKVFAYSLAAARERGPVIVYFFPAAFSAGCSVEAHAFAEAIPQFEALGATVVGVSGDDIETLSRFSVHACQGRFPVAADVTQSVMRSYDAVLKTRPEYANRVSYGIAPDGAIFFHFMSLDPNRHVAKVLAALREWKAAHP
ncbi:MAG: peroxiredoxin [Burkholderiales bacterium]